MKIDGSWPLHAVSLLIQKILSVVLSQWSGIVWHKFYDTPSADCGDSPLPDTTVHLKLYHKIFRSRRELIAGLHELTT